MAVPPHLTDVHGLATFWMYWLDYCPFTIRLIRPSFTHYRKETNLMSIYKGTIYGYSEACGEVAHSRVCVCVVVVARDAKPRPLPPSPSHSSESRGNIYPFYFVVYSYPKVYRLVMACLMLTLFNSLLNAYRYLSNYINRAVKLMYQMVSQ